MPRLAPDGNRCKEHRITTGTAERKMLATMIREHSKDRTQRYVTGFVSTINAALIAAGIGTAGYFAGQAISELNPVDKFVDGNKILWATFTGRKYDPTTGIWTNKKYTDPLDKTGVEFENPLAGVPFFGAGPTPLGPFFWGNWVFKKK